MANDNEIELHDSWAGSEDPAWIDIYGVMESVNAVENRYMTSVVEGVLGGFEGLDVLDVGVGLGESSVYFASKGAHVTAVDLSPGMVDFCGRLAGIHGVSDRVRGVVSGAEEFNAEDESFDVIYAANVIHHLHDVDGFIGNCHRMLRPGGLFLSMDPLRYNPVINVYRRMATEVRSEDEEPVGFDLPARFARLFSRVEHREFWLGALCLFLKFYLVDRRDPNKVRYWKAIYEERTRTHDTVMKFLHGLDSILLRVPLLRRLAWNIVITARK